MWSLGQWKHHHNQDTEPFHFPKSSLLPLNSHHALHQPAQRNTNLFSVTIDLLPYLEFYVNGAVQSVLCVFSITQHNVSKFHPHFLVHSSVMLRCKPLYKQTTISYLSSSDGNLDVSCFVLIWGKLLWTFMCRSFVDTSSFPLGTYLGV